MLTNFSTLLTLFLLAGTTFLFFLFPPPTEIEHSPTSLINQSPIPTGFLTEKNQKEILIKNKRGVFHLIKKPPIKSSLDLDKKEEFFTHPSSNWVMSGPDSTTIPQNIIDTIFRYFNLINVEKIFAANKANTFNYALDDNQKILSINLIHQSGKSINLNMGLKNTAENYSFIKMDSYNFIFQTKAPNPPLDQWQLHHFFTIPVLPPKFKKITFIPLFTLETKGNAPAPNNTFSYSDFNGELWKKMEGAPWKTYLGETPLKILNDQDSLHYKIIIEEENKETLTLILTKPQSYPQLEELFAQIYNEKNLNSNSSSEEDFLLVPWEQVKSFFELIKM
jgi:hypothetical protein